MKPTRHHGRRRVNNTRSRGPRALNGGKLLRSFGYAAAGVVGTFAREQNFRVHVVAALIVIGAAALLGISRLEWIVVLLLIAGVLALELINTAIESVVDLASPGRHPLAARAKDAAAGAVLVAAVGAATIGALIFLPRLWALASG